MVHCHKHVQVPFDRLYLLVFGGRTYEHRIESSTNRLVYHHCELLDKDIMAQHPSWRSCLEYATNDLWRSAAGTPPGRGPAGSTAVCGAAEVTV